MKRGVVVLIQVRQKDPKSRQTVCRDVSNLLRTRHGLDVDVVAVPPHSLPQTSSGQLSRSRARSLFLEGRFADASLAVSGGE